MAAKFEIIMLHVYHFVILLFLFRSTVANNSKQTFEARFDTEKWLKTYDIINITAEFNSSEHFEHRGTPLCYLHFEYKQMKFTLGLVKTDQIPPSIQIRVDGHEIDFSGISKQLSLYRGAVFKNGVYIQCNIMLTQDGIDGVVKIGNDTIIVEPLKNGNRFSMTDHCKERYCKRLEVHPCIFYRPGDMIDTNNGSYVLPNDGLISKLNTKVLTNTTVKSREKRNAHYTDCTLHLVADHTFYQTVGNEDIVNTISKMMYLVTESNTVFRSTDFDGDGIGDNVGFFVSQISIFTTNEQYKMADMSLTVYTYLDAFSEYDFDDVCLGVAFSSRDFSDGVLGLAWVASSSFFGASGGICQRRVTYQDTAYSLNTNLITVINHGERVPIYKSALTLTHELGHSFGSPHDDTADVSCVPNNDFGNYIMYPYANDGSKPNHIVFSACSVGYIHPVITIKGSTCFSSSTQVCGNGIKEEHEECDCGSSSICDLLDSSCTPSDVSNSNPDPPCTVRRASGCQCSRVSSPCCTAQCQFAESWKLCRVGGECVRPSYCSGTSGECPQIALEPDDKLCNNNRKTCLSGKCIGSVCSLFDSEECDCDPGPYECHVCCLTDGQCLPSMINDTYIAQSVGSPCRQMQGFCDKHTSCILQDPDSVVKRLKDVFTPKSVNEIVEWLQLHWYYVVAGTGGLLLVAGIFVATCRQRLDVHTRAFMYGQFMRIKREAELQKKYIEERKKLVDSKYESEIEKVEKGSKKMALTKAVARMKVFFPTAPNQELEKVLKMSSKEEMAVLLTLMKGFPFRRVSRPVTFEDENSLIY